MRIAQISTAACACGIAEYTRYLTEALIGLGHETKVFGEVTKENLPYNVPYTLCWERFNRESYRNLVKELDEFKPDVVHLQYEWNLHMCDGLLFELAKPRPHFVTWHNVTFDEKEHWFGRMSDYHVAHNQPTLTALRRMNLAAQVVPHGTRQNKITPTDEAKKALGIDPSKKVVTLFGFVGPRKGTHLLLQAIPRLKEYCPEAYLVILGGKHPKGAGINTYVKLVERAAELYPEDIGITGYMSDEDKTDLWLSATDMLVFPHVEPPNQQILSASGSVRRVIDHGKLIATMDIGFYSDFGEDVILKIPKDLSFMSLGRWIGRHLATLDSPEHEAMRQKLKAYAKATYWPEVAKQHVGYYQTAIRKPVNVAKVVPKSTHQLANEIVRDGIKDEIERLGK